MEELFNSGAGKDTFEGKPAKRCGSLSKFYQINISKRFTTGGLRQSIFDDNIQNTNGNTQDSILPEHKEDLLEQDKYEVLMVSGDNKIIRQERLLFLDAFILILSATLGAQFQFIVGPMIADPFQTILIIVLLAATTWAASQLILRTVQMTKLSSYQEIAYFLGGGRASIFFITFLLVTYYLTLPSEYLTGMTLTIIAFFDKVNGINMMSEEISPMKFSVTLLSLCMIIIPLCSIKNIQKFKILAYIVLFIDITIVINAFLVRFIPKPGYLVSYSNFYELQNPWNYLFEFQNLFQFQIYYLYVLQLQGEKQHRQEGNKLNNGISVALVIYVILFASFAASGYLANDGDQPTNFLKFFSEVFLENYIGMVFYLQNILIVFLAFPFKFYIAKEFLFILADEYFNKSLSNKIDLLKTYTSTKGVYTDDMVKKVKDDIYHIVRQPYLKHKFWKHVVITICVFVVNILICYFYYFISKRTFIDLLWRVEILKIYKGAIQPILMFVLPGLLYYRACIYFQDDSKSKNWGLIMVCIGAITTVLTFALSIYFSVVTITSFI